MRKLFVILSFLIFSVVGMAQNDFTIVERQNSDNEAFKKEHQANAKLGYDDLYSEYETISMQLAKTNYYLDKYSRQALAGDVMIIVGSVFTSLAAFCESYDTAILCTVGGLTTGIAGYIMKLSAYNHLQSSRIRYDGFKVTYSL